MKCLEKDRNRRYETANGLALDIERHLRHEPVTARPPTRLYQFQKLVRRHRVGFLAAASVLLAVLIGTAVATLALFREREARRQSDHRLKTALAFVDEIFTQIAPEIRHLTGAASANEKLAQSGLRFVEHLNNGLGDEPDLRLAVARQLLRLSHRQNPGDGNTIGNYEAGLERAQEALAILNDGSFDVHGPAGFEMMYSARFAAAQCLVALGRMDEAVAEWKAALPLLDQLEAFPEHARLARRNRANILNNSGYALILANRPQEAVDDYLLPTLRSDWTKQVRSNYDAATDLELEVVANLHVALSTGYLFLERFDQMLPLQEPATNLWNYITQRHPLDGAYAAQSAMSTALHGCALLVNGSTEQGFILLDQARRTVNSLVEKDSLNDRFLYARVIVAALRALAVAHWSNDLTSPFGERTDRLQQAEAFLTEAEEFARATKAKFSDRYLHVARTLISRAKATSEKRPPL